MADRADKPELVEKTTRIVEAFVAHNQVDLKDLPTLIGEVHAALDKIAQDVPVQERLNRKTRG